jgi:branched-subunit amino acid ABC-type transport system permease component
MFGLGIACAGAAGVALAMVFPFSPNTQVQWLAWAFLGVILGGLGKVENTLAAGLVVGLIQTVCTALLPFDYVYLVLYLLLAAIFRAASWDGWRDGGDGATWPSCKASIWPNRRCERLLVGAGC